MKKKGKVALFLTGTLIFASGFSVKLNHDQSQAFADHVATYAENVEDDNFNIAAHRGFSSLEVENTKEALELASDKNYVDYIEVDARLTRDQKIVLSHNNQLFITHDTTKDVSSMNYEDALERTFYYESMPIQFSLWRSSENNFLLGRYMELNGREYQLSGLVEGLEACGDKKILLDLKFNRDIEEFVDELKEELKDVDTSNIVFQSLNIPGIQYLRDHSDFHCLALLDSKSDLKYIDDFDAVGIKSSLITPDVIDKVVSQNKTLALWTIDSTEELNRVVDLLGDYYPNIIYITNYPDLIAMDLHEIELQKKQ